MEYKYCAFKFARTINGRDDMTLNIKNTFKMMMKEGGHIPGMERVRKVEKIYNCAIYERVENEMKKILTKNKKKSPLDLMRHLFHGTRNTDPYVIYSVLMD